jgi:translation initiation factor 3 subunit M
LQLVDDEELAIEAIKYALTIPSYLEFDDIIALPSFENLKTTNLGQLFEIFHTKQLLDFKTFIKTHKVLSENDLDESLLLLKIQVLTLADFAAKHLGKLLKFTEIAKVVEITTDDVEFLVIEAMRRGLMDAKIDQLTETVFIKYFIID